MAAATDQILTTTDPSSPSIIPVITTTTITTTATTTLTTPTTTVQKVPTESNASLDENNKRKCSLGSITVDSLSASSSSSSLGSINASTSLSAIDHHGISLKSINEENKKITGSNTNSNVDINIHNNNTANNGNKPMVSTTTHSPSAKQPQKVLPFESIKTKIDQNNVPDAQFIKRHIDNLISHNEAIIDSWNLVNVRSCSTSTTSGNESLNNSCKEIASSPPPSSSTRLQTRSSTGDSITNSLNLADDRPSSSKGLLNKNQQRLPASRSRKRWSTTALGGLQQLRQQNQSTTTELALNNLSTTSMSQQKDSQRSMNETQSAWSQNFHPSFQFKQSLEFDTNFNPFRRSSIQHLPVGSSSDYSSSLLLSGNHPQSFSSMRGAASNSLETAKLIQQANFLSSSPIPSSAQATGTSSLNASEIQHLLDLHRAHATEGQLESAIQNLSLRRREEDFRQQQKQLSQEHQAQMMLQNQASLNQRQESVGLNLSNPGAGSGLFVPMALLNLNNRVPLASTDTSMLEDPNVLAALINEKQRQLQTLIESGLPHMFSSAQEMTWSKQQSAIDNLSPGIDVRQSNLERQQQSKVRNLSTPVAPSVSQQPVSQQQPSMNNLDSALINRILATMCVEDSSRKLSSPSLNQTTSTSICQMPTVSHTDRTELLDKPMDGATPAHRCETCDIPFWTRDLLNYHRLTQCVSRKESMLSTNEPLAYNFTGPNNYELLNQQMQQNLKDSSAQPHSSPISANRGKPSKSVSPPRSRCSLEQLNEDSDGKDGTLHRQPHLEETTTFLRGAQANDPGMEGEGKDMDELSILKQQLLQSNSSSEVTRIGQVIAPESLPLKKRKISEPNMRYRPT